MEVLFEILMPDEFLFSPSHLNGILASVNNTLYLHLMSQLLILNIFLSLYHLVGMKKYYCAQCELPNSKKGQNKDLSLNTFIGWIMNMWTETLGLHL